MTAAYPELTEVFPVLKKLKGTESPREKAPSLAERAERDLKKGAVWFSDDEHARYHDVNGAKILCILDRYDMAAASGGSARADTVRRTEGVQADTLLLFIRSDEFRGTPRRGQEIKVDGARYIVESFIDFDGVLEITIRGVSAR